MSAACCGRGRSRTPATYCSESRRRKTISDPIGNEEQLLNTKRKGMLVDLRCGPHEVVQIKTPGGLEALRQEGEAVNKERAFCDLKNFVTDLDGADIQGNRGERWPHSASTSRLF